jgi:two-component system cell cycle sensor histidine kinase/response regulator CckA
VTTNADSVLLLVEDDSAHAELALRALEKSQTLQVRVVESVREARELLCSQHVDLVLSDLKLPDGSGLDLLDTGVPLVVQTSQGDEVRAVAAMKGGALDYCVKSPEMFRDLPVIIERALNAGRNLRERRRAEQSLRESDERFRQLAENIPEVFWLYDIASRRIIYANPAWTAVYGDCDRSWQGRLTYLHPEDVDAVREAPVPMAPSAVEFRVVRSGRVLWLEERMFPIYTDSGEPFRIACLGADITRRHELANTARQAQKMQAVGQLAGGVAHDFNNMLAAIMSAADELSLAVSAPASKALCALILQASERAAELTRNLLSFSRMGKVRTAPVDVNALIREVVALLERSIDRRVAIHLALSASEHTVAGDAAQLQSALLNLGINARDAMPGGGEIQFSSEVVKLGIKECQALPFDVGPGRFLLVTVRDSGCGIAQHVMPRIFEPFFTTKEPGRGTGMGLAAVYGAVVEHRGALTVQSEVGSGTEFRLYLPLLQHAPVASDRVRSTPSGRGLVLLVDDEPLVLTAVSQMLRSIGYEVITARDGKEGFQLFLEHRSALVAVVCDAVMPRESGPELLQRIGEIAPALPCLLCSGFARDTRLLPVRANWVLLPKPFHRADLAQTLAQAISACRLAQTGGAS